MSRKKSKEQKRENYRNINDSIEIENSRLEFLYFTLNALDNRRSAIDSRTNVVLLLSTTVVVFFSTQLSEDNFFFPSNLFLLINAIIIATEAVFGCIYSLLLISPLTRKRKERKKGQKSLSWFYIIADMQPENYKKEIQEKDKLGIAEELSVQIVLISRLLKKRYLRMKKACVIQYIVLVHLLLYIIAVLLFTYLTPETVILPIKI